MTDLNSPRRGGHFEEPAFRPAELIRTQISMISSRSNPVVYKRDGLFWGLSMVTQSFHEQVILLWKIDDL
jgi:hypothetical protein